MSISSMPIVYAVQYGFTGPVRYAPRPRPPVRSFHFGPFTLEPERQTLLKNGCPVRIGGRALDILTALVERPGEVVTKRELVARVWPETLVEEANLKVNVAGLRRILGENANAPHYIATVVGRGYRFVADVKPLMRVGAIAAI